MIMKHNDRAVYDGDENLYAEIIADSVAPNGVRLTTMEVRMHRFILAEMNTHRAFSRNSASSRAIPYVKIRNAVAANPAMPVVWGSERKGMQSGDELPTEFKHICYDQWHKARIVAIDVTDVLHEVGLHKSLVNRILEPFMYHTAIITATDWDNFFYQRCDPAAQPEMKAVADLMQYAYYTSEPEPLGLRNVHTPYVEDTDELMLHEEDLMKVSIARCARVSYLQHDGTRSIDKDLELFERLKAGKHWSPFEHVAIPAHDAEYLSGNFRGWYQYRHWKGLDTSKAKFIPNLKELEGLI